MKYSIESLKKGVIEAKAATEAALKAANAEGAEVVKKLAEKFISTGGKPTETADPVLLSTTSFTPEVYDRAVRELGFLSGAEVEEGDLTETCLHLINSAGKISTFKRIVSIG